MKTKTGFTLIELLVVIAIIAILAAILFPVFARVREKARQTACMSNMKQMGLGVAQYYQDFDETTPNGTYWTGRIGGWAGQIYPYVKSIPVFRCPDDVKVVLATDNPSSYAMNVNLGIAGNNSAGILNTSVTLAKMSAPAMTVMLFEVEGNTNVDITQPMEGPFTKNFNSSPYGNGVVDGYSPGGGGSIPSCPAPAGSSLKFATGYMGGRNIVNGTGDHSCNYTGPLGRHSDGSNFLMADTHAKWLRGSTVSSGSNAASATAAEATGQYGAASGTEGTMPGGKPAATFSIL